MGQCCLRQAIGCARNLLEALCRDSSEEEARKAAALERQLTGYSRQLCSITRARLRSVILSLGQRFTAARYVCSATR